jgi:hypothetical protein
MKGRVNSVLISIFILSHPFQITFPRSPSRRQASPPASPYTTSSPDLPNVTPPPNNNINIETHINNTSRKKERGEPCSSPRLFGRCENHHMPPQPRLFNPHVRSHDTTRFTIRPKYVEGTKPGEIWGMHA